MSGREADHPTECPRVSSCEHFRCASEKFKGKLAFLWVGAGTGEDVTPLDDMASDQDAWDAAALGRIGGRISKTRVGKGRLGVA